MEAYARLQVELSNAIEITSPSPPVDNVLRLEWNHNSAVMRANLLAKTLGMPYRYDKKAGGVCIWINVSPYFEETDIYDVLESQERKPKDVYSKLMVKDESVPHIVPAPHNDYFYAFMYMDIPSDKVNDVRALTESAGYDTMTKEAYARCHFMPANLTSLFLIKQIAQGHKSLEKARQEYVVYIPILAKEEKEGKGLSSGNPGPFHIALTNYLFEL